MSNYQEWRKQKLQARLLATGETDTSDLTEKHYIKYLEEENEKLKEEYEIYKDNAETLKKILYEENEKLKKNNHSYVQMGLSLKEENEKLKERIKQIDEYILDTFLNNECAEPVYKKIDKIIKSIN